MDKKIKNAIKLLFEVVLLLPYEFAPERLGIRCGEQSQEMKA
jgi:hypothetical protein